MTLSDISVETCASDYHQILECRLSPNLPGNKESNTLCRRYKFHFIYALCHRDANLLKRSEMKTTYRVVSNKCASKKLVFVKLICHVLYLNYLIVRVLLAWHRWFNMEFLYRKWNLGVFGRMFSEFFLMSTVG